MKSVYSTKNANHTDISGSGSLNAIELTSFDAAESKVSANRLGYIDDPFIQYFFGHQHVNTIRRRSPIINRGYYARVKSIDDKLKAFIQNVKALGERYQILSLGAGVDTTYFRFMKNGWIDPKTSLFLELDLPNIVQRKQKFMKDHSYIFDSYLLDHESYSLVECDLRVIDQVQQIITTYLDPNTPTFILSECVLIYLEAEYSNSVIEFLSTYFTKRTEFVLYEQILPNDPFGKMMVDNLKLRGCDIVGISHHPDIESQIQRFLTRGFTKVIALDLNDVYYKLIPTEERLKIEKIEFLDELEEFQLIMQHYVLVHAIKND